MVRYIHNPLRARSASTFISPPPLQHLLQWSLMLLRPAHYVKPSAPFSPISEPFTRSSLRTAPLRPRHRPVLAAAASEGTRPSLFVPPGVSREEAAAEVTVLPWSNIVVGPYAGHAQVRQAEFAGSSARARDCPRDGLPEFAILGRSNVGKSSLINMLVRKKEFALTSKKPGKTQLINHFLLNKSWYIVDLPGYGFANAPESTRMDWSSFTKGYFLNRDTLVGVLLLIDASIPSQKIDLDCADWLARNNIAVTFVFTKCDKIKGGKGSRPEENIRTFQELMRKFYQEPLPWIMTSSKTGLGRDELLLHMSQLRNYWDN